MCTLLAWVWDTCSDTCELNIQSAKHLSVFWCITLEPVTSYHEWRVQGMLVLPQFDSTTVTSGQFRSRGSIGVEACYLNKITAVYRPLAKNGRAKLIKYGEMLVRTTTRVWMGGLGTWGYPYGLFLLVWLKSMGHNVFKPMLLLVKNVSWILSQNISKSQGYLVNGRVLTCLNCISLKLMKIYFFECCASWFSDKA